MIGPPLVVMALRVVVLVPAPINTSWVAFIKIPAVVDVLTVRLEFGLTFLPYASIVPVAVIAVEIVMSLVLPALPMRTPEGTLVPQMLSPSKMTAAPNELVVGSTTMVPPTFHLYWLATAMSLQSELCIRMPPLALLNSVPPPYAIRPLFAVTEVPRNHIASLAALVE